MQHLAGASALAGPAAALTGSIEANAQDLKRRGKSAILLWMGGGASTIDMWDLKPGANTSGPFKPINTTGEAQICEHLPMMAEQMKHLSIVRSMSTREADHTRGRYYMHTGYVPNPNVQHPSYGAVLSHELMNPVRKKSLDIPPFVAVGGGSVGPGFLGMTWAPFVVNSNGDVRNLKMGIDRTRLMQRMRMLSAIEEDFIRQGRGEAASDHGKILQKTLTLMTSKQMAAFKIGSEPEAVRKRYGTDSFGRGCLMARRLVEAGVPFVEVDMGGWDNHANIFPTLQDTKLPALDRAMSALVADLVQRGMWQDTVVMLMGEFSRTPRINGNTGRDHWARAWSVVVGGGGFGGGRTIGKTNAEGTVVETHPHSSEDLMASVCQALGISLKTRFTSRSGRPMQIANKGTVIKELFG